MQAYTRDPNELFSQYRAVPISSRQTWSFNNHRMTRVFRDVKLKHPTVGSAVLPDEIFYEARVNFYTGGIQLFEDESSVVNGMPVVSITDGGGGGVLPQVALKEHWEYASEVLGLMVRGHSFFHPNCTCYAGKYGMSLARSREVGVVSGNGDPQCLVPHISRGFKASVIAKELAVDSLHKEFRRGLTLLDCLIKFGKMQIKPSLLSSPGEEEQENKIGNIRIELTDPMVWCPSCCIPDKFNTIQEIIKAAQIMHPGPLMVAKADIAADVLPELIEKNNQKILHVLRASKPHHLSIFWESRGDLYIRPDRGVIDLWNAHPNDKLLLIGGSKK